MRRAKRARILAAGICAAVAVVLAAPAGPAGAAIITTGGDSGWQSVNDTISFGHQCQVDGSDSKYQAVTCADLKITLFSDHGSYTPYLSGTTQGLCRTLAGVTAECATIKETLGLYQQSPPTMPPAITRESQTSECHLGCPANGRFYDQTFAWIPSDWQVGSACNSMDYWTAVTQIQVTFLDLTEIQPPNIGSMHALTVCINGTGQWRVTNF